MIERHNYGGGEVSISPTQRLKTSIVDMVEECNDYPTDGITLIIRERAKQVAKCGYSIKHDDEHKYGELRAAAIAYLLSPDIGGEGPIGHWPFERESFNPGVGIEPLVKAGAMIAAEIDRLLRVQGVVANREPFSLEQLSANLDAVVRQPAPPDASGNASECKWVVGQWVEAWGRVWRIIETGQTRSKLDGNGEPSWWCNHGEMNPFEWQIDKRYKTTIDGVTATIYRVDGHGNVSGSVGPVSQFVNWWHAKTGKDFSTSRGADFLPYLADEKPSIPPVEHPSSKIERAAQKALEKMDECNETLRQSELKIKNDEAAIEKLFGYPVSEIGDKLDRLQSFEKVAEALWPFVRYFIIAGACPEAINCVVDLGRLLGHTEASKSTIAEIGERVRAETLDEVAVRLESLLWGKVLSKHLPEVLDAVRKM